MESPKKPEFDAFKYLLEFPTGRSAKRVVLPRELQLTFYERQNITWKVHELGGVVVSEEHMCSATHIVGSGLYSYSPTLLEALARGLWVVNIFYITDSYEQLKWLDDLQYELKLETDVIGSAARRNRELALVRRNPNFSSWKIGLLSDYDDPVSRTVTRLLDAGGAKFFHVSKRTDVLTLIYEVDWVLLCERSMNCKEMVKKLSERGILCIRLGFLIDTLLMRCPEPMTRYIFNTNDISCHQQDTEYSLLMYGYSKKRKHSFLDQEHSFRKREKFADKQRCRIYNSALCENDDFLEIHEIPVPSTHSSIYDCNTHLQYDRSCSFSEDQRNVLQSVQSVTAYPECGYMEEYHNQSRVESQENFRPYLLNNCQGRLDTFSQDLVEMQQCELNMEEASELGDIDDVAFSPVEDSPDEWEILDSFICDKPLDSELKCKFLDEACGRQSSAKPSAYSDANIVGSDKFLTQDEMLLTDVLVEQDDGTYCADLCAVKESNKSCASTQEETTVFGSHRKGDRTNFSDESYDIHFRPDTIKRHNPSTDEESGFHSLAEEEKVDDGPARECSVNFQFVDGMQVEVEKETSCKVSNLGSDVSQLLVDGSSCVSTFSEQYCSANSLSKRSKCTEVKSSQTNYLKNKYRFSDHSKSETEVIHVDELKVKKNSTPHWTQPRKLHKMTQQEIRKLVKAHIETDLDDPWLSLGVPGSPICCERSPAHVQMFSVPASNILKSMLHRGLWYGAFNFFDMAVDIGILPDAHVIQMMFDLILDTHDEDVLARTCCSIDRLFRKYPPCSLHLNVYYKKVLASKPEDDVLHPGGMIATLLDLLEDELNDASENEQMLASGPKSKKHKYRDLPKPKRCQRIFMLLDCLTDALASDIGRWMQQHYLSVDRALWPERPLAESALRQWGIGMPTKSDIKLLFRVCLQLGDPGKLPYCKRETLLRLMHIAAEVFHINEDNPKAEYPHFGAECEFFADQLFLQMEEYGLDLQISSQLLDSVTPPWVAMLVSKKIIERQLGEQLRHPLLSIAAVLKERLKHTKEWNDDSMNRQNKRIVKDLPLKEDITKAASVGETPLHTACAKGNVNEVHHILSTSYVDVNEYDSSGNTALCIAVQLGHKNCVAELLKFKPENGSQRVDASMPGACGDPPILAAARSGRTDICDMLLEHSGPVLLECVTHHQLKTALKSIPEDLCIILKDPWKFYGHVVPPLCRPLSPEVWSVLSPVLPVITKSYLHVYNFVSIVCDPNVQKKVRRNSNPPTPRTVGQNVANDYRMISYQLCSLLRTLRRIEKCKCGSFNVNAYRSITILDEKLQGSSSKT